jgi:hypothetical protein
VSPLDDDEHPHASNAVKNKDVFSMGYRIH